VPNLLGREADESGGVAGELLGASVLVGHFHREGGVIGRRNTQELAFTSFLVLARPEGVADNLADVGFGHLGLEFDLGLFLGGFFVGFGFGLEIFLARLDQVLELRFEKLQIGQVGGIGHKVDRIGQQFVGVHGKPLSCFCQATYAAFVCSTILQRPNLFVNPTETPFQVFSVADPFILSSTGLFVNPHFLEAVKAYLLRFRRCLNPIN